MCRWVGPLSPALLADKAAAPGSVALGNTRHWSAPINIKSRNMPCRQNAQAPQGCEGFIATSGPICGPRTPLPRLSIPPADTATRTSLGPGLGQRLGFQSQVILPMQAHEQDDHRRDGIHEHADKRRVKAGDDGGVCRRRQALDDQPAMARIAPVKDENSAPTPHRAFHGKFLLRAMK